MHRECERYGMDPKQVQSALAGEDPMAQEPHSRSWWEALIVLAALGIFVWLGLQAQRQPIAIAPFWAVLLGLASLGFLGASALVLWKRTRFS